jgi:hypothetical protein
MSREIIYHLYIGAYDSMNEKNKKAFGDVKQEK